MKFKVIAYTGRKLILPTLDVHLARYTIQSLCGKYRKNINGCQYESNLKDGLVSFHNESAVQRVRRRLSKIGIDVKLVANFPWIYLDKVNGVKVKEKKNSEHGWCITYHNTDLRNITFRKDLFSKIREIMRG